MGVPDDQITGAAAENADFGTDSPGWLDRQPFQFAGYRRADPSPRNVQLFAHRL